MSMLCTIGGHSPANEIYNSGYYFCACARCARELVRAPYGDWHTAPPGHRIVWKAGRHRHSIEADYAAVLPVPIASAALPALPGPFASWRRDLVRLRPRPARATAVAIEQEEAGDFPCPRWLLLAVMLGAGLKVLLTLGAAR